MSTAHKRDGWEQQPGLHEVNGGKGKVYRNMVRFDRRCATCNESFGVYVTESCADGMTHNSSFGLKNCEKHRMRMVAHGGAGSAGELEKLQMMVSVMKQELEGLYATERELRARIRDLENPTTGAPVMKVKGGFRKWDDVPFDPHALLAAEIKNNSKKMPWDA